MLLEFGKNIFLDFLLLEANVKIRIFPILMAYWSGFGILKQNQDNPDEIVMVGQSVNVFINFKIKKMKI